IEVNPADYPNQLNAQLDNQGTLILNDDLTINKPSANHTNSGMIRVIGSTTRLILLGADFLNDSTGVLTGDGRIDVINVPFTNSGITNPGDSLGTLDILGNLPQEGESIINIDLGGPIADSLYDRLDISGQAYLNGTLNINLINNYNPNSGEEFQILTFNSRVDSFAVVNGLQLGSCKFFTIHYTDTSVYLTVHEITGTSPPVGLPDTLTMYQDTTIVANILLNDTDPDNDPLFLVSLGTPQHGTAVITGDSTIMYLPDSGFVGIDLFTYTMRDLPGCLGSSVVTVHVDSIVTGIINNPIINEIPQHYSLQQNYPNPFNPTTTFQFDIPRESQVTLKIFNIMGEEVATLISEKLPAGQYKHLWNASHLASGIYIYKIQADQFVMTRKMMLIK
ncbi:MAG: T9SS type A sorting domain-containing protein, partial [bacterium]